MKPSFFSCKFKEIEKVLVEQNLPKSGAVLLYRWHHKKMNIEPLIKDLAKKTQEYIYSNYSFELPQIIQIHESTDQTIKLLL